MNKKLFVLIAVIALVVIIGVQAFQINELKQDIVAGNVNIGGASGSSNSNSYSNQGAAPTMVGGC